MSISIKSRLSLTSALVVSALCISACQDKADTKTPPEMDLCVTGGNIYGHGPTDLHIKDGKIAAIPGADNDCAVFKNTKTKIADIKGGFIYPGFIDAHAHLLGIGLREMTLNLEGTQSIEDLVAKLKMAAADHSGGTLYGRGWIETHWPENRFPSRRDLDEAAPDFPVILERADGHASVVNSKALELAGITSATKAPFGGDILLGADGQPTGMLIDNAANLVMPLMAELTPARKEAAYIKAGEVYASRGWTAIQSMSVDPSNIAMIERLSDEGKLKIRVYNAVDTKGADTLLSGIAQNGPQRNANGRVTTRAIKLYADGALGSRGAALLAPYSDDPKNDGLLLAKQAETVAVLKNALRNGIQVSMHAIGDRANKLVLDWYEEAMQAVPESERAVKQPRWRIEHSQILDRADIARFSQLGVIASMQPSHAIGDLHFAVDRLGVDRLAGGYAWRSLIDSGAIIAGGSDAPVEVGDPRIEFYAAAIRKDAKGFSAKGWYPEEKVTRAEAIKMLTFWPAYAAFNEKHGGAIKAGNDADLTVFSGDLMQMPAADILRTEPILTVVDGEVVFSGDN